MRYAIVGQLVSSDWKRSRSVSPLYIQTRVREKRKLKHKNDVITDRESDGGDDPRENGCGDLQTGGKYCGYPVVARVYHKRYGRRSLRQWCLYTSVRTRGLGISLDFASINILVPTFQYHPSTNFTVKFHIGLRFGNRCKLGHLVPETCSISIPLCWYDHKLTVKRLPRYIPLII